MRNVIFSLALLAPGFFIACTGKEDDTGSGGDNGGDNGGENGGNGGDELTFEDFVNTTDAYVGDTVCFDGTTWIDQTPGAGCTSDVTVSGTVSDFQQDEPVPGASMNVWLSDDINAAPDLSFDVDSNGAGTITVPACTPMGYETYTPEEWQETVDTYEVHQVYGWSSAGTDTDTWNSVSVATSRLIPSLLGLEWSPGTAIIAGTAYDCNEDPIQHAQVFIHDASGAIPADLAVRYFANGLPNSDQPDTNDDGLWSAINVPPGEWIVEMWVYDGAAPMLLGTTNLTMEPDSVVISNIYTGIDDGVYLPASCLEACE